MFKQLFIIIVVLFYAEAQNLRLVGTSYPDISQYSSLPTLTYNRNQKIIGDPIDFNHTIPDTFVVNEIFTFAGEVNGQSLFQYLRPISPLLSSWKVNIILKDKKTGD